MCSTRRQLLGAAIVLGLAPGMGRAAAPPLRVVTTDVPPLVVERGGARPGALHEIVTELCRRLGRSPQLQFFPWKRAIFLATHLPQTTIFPLTRLSERERQFRWLAQLYEEQYTFLAPRGRGFDVRNYEQMRDRRITLLRGSSLQEVLRELGFRHIVEANSVDEVHRFLVEAMADAAFGELAIIRASLATRRATHDFDVGAPVRRTAAWLAGSLDFTASDAARFQAAMKTIVDDGTHGKILERYQLA